MAKTESVKLNEDELKTIRSLIVRLKHGTVHDADWQLIKILHAEIHDVLHGED